MYGMRQAASYLPNSPEIGRLPLPAENISDGTKLPMVVDSSENHQQWYED